MVTLTPLTTTYVAFNHLMDLHLLSPIFNQTYPLFFLKEEKRDQKFEKCERVTKSYQQLTKVTHKRENDYIKHNFETSFVLYCTNKISATIFGSLKME